MFSEDTQKFLFYSCYGKTWEQLNDKKESGEAIYYCFRLAYRDFNRTLNFYKENDLPNIVFYDQQDKEETIGYKINHILFSSDSRSFDASHKKICEDIIRYAEGAKCLNGKFYYGQAQKWLNMTLKYMYMTEIWEDEFDKIKEFLHIPMDSYILRAVFNANTRAKVNGKEGNKEGNLINGDYNWAYCDGSLKPKEVKFNGEYAKDNKGNIKAIRWSRINDPDDYFTIEKKIKECIPQKGSYSKCDPLKWENKVWMIMAGRRYDETL